MTDERTFYSDETGIRITGTRAIFKNTTYSMANISSIRTSETPAKRGGAIVALIRGIIIFIIGISADVTALSIVGVIVALLGILWIWLAHGKHHIMITSVSGEISALESKDKEYVHKVAQALNEAIIHRG